MESEETQEIESNLGVFDVVHMQPEHDPSPPIQLVDHPSGEGTIGLVKTGEHTWEVKRFGGPEERVCRHLFDDLGTYAAWLKRTAQSPRQAQVFVDLDCQPGENGRKVQARLDPRDPEGDFVVCGIRFTPEYEAWVAATERKTLDQRALFKLVRAHGEGSLRPSVAENLLGSLAALRIVTNGEFKTELAANGRTTVSGLSADIQVSKELPAELDLSIPIYEGVDVPTGPGGDLLMARYSMRAMLDVEAGPLGLAVQISYPDLSVVVRQAGRDLVTHLQRDLGDDWLVCQGRENSKNVPVLREDVERPFAGGE